MEINQIKPKGFDEREKARREFRQRRAQLSIQIADMLQPIFDSDDYEYCSGIVQNAMSILAARECQATASGDRLKSSLIDEA